MFQQSLGTLTDPFHTAYRLVHLEMQNYGLVFNKSGFKNYFPSALPYPSKDFWFLIKVFNHCPGYHRILPHRIIPSYYFHYKYICKIAVFEVQCIFILFAYLLLQVTYQGKEHRVPLRLFNAILMLYLKKKKKQLHDAKKTSSLLYKKKKSTCSHFPRDLISLINENQQVSY